MYDRAERCMLLKLFESVLETLRWGWPIAWIGLYETDMPLGAHCVGQGACHGHISEVVMGQAALIDFSGS